MHIKEKDNYRSFYYCSVCDIVSKQVIQKDKYNEYVAKSQMSVMSLMGNCWTWDKKPENIPYHEH